MITARTISLALFMTLWPVASYVAADSEAPLIMDVSPHVSFAPATVRIRVRIAPSIQNRALSVSAESEEFYRSSEVQLEGEQAPRTMSFEFRSLPTGSYVIHGSLYGLEGHERGCVKQTASVMAGSSER